MEKQENDIEMENVEKYAKYFSSEKFWKKIKNVFTKAGTKVTYLALLLYYVIIDQNVLIADKAKIIGALGYFILPLDLIPDFIPLAGYADDLTALLVAYNSVKKNITPEIENKARVTLLNWFGTVDFCELDI